MQEELSDEKPKKSCFASKTPFQVGLITVLMLAIFFLIAMIIVYILFGVFANKSGSCDVLCCKLDIEMDQNGRRKRFIFPLTTSKDCSLDGEKPEIPSIGALLENLYADEDYDTIFKCAVAIVSPNWAFTTNLCIEEVDSSAAPVLRVGSNYWSAGGAVGKIKEVVVANKSERPALVLVNFEKIECVKPVKIAKEGVLDEYHYFSWNGNLSAPLARRWKKSRLERVDFGLYRKLENCSNFDRPEDVSCFAVKKDQRCGNTVNAPMLDSNDLLVGVHLETFCPENEDYAVVFYLDVRAYGPWLEQMLN